MYKIKQIPEDFIVEEISNVKPAGSGRFVYFILKKKNYTTERALEEIAKYLKIDRKRLGYAGTKDRIAVTSQVCSCLGNIRNISLKDIEITMIGRGEDPVSLGDLIGNKFIITVRNIQKKPDPIEMFPNLFGEQRFSENNAEIGKLIVKLSFKEALDIMLKRGGHLEERVKEHLDRFPSDYSGGLRRLPKNILKLYIHSYQSLLWNKIVEEAVSQGKAMKIPIIGFATEIPKGELGKRFDALLKKEGITQRDFIIRQLPGMSSAGDNRELFARIEELQVSELVSDELNPGMSKCVVSFTLAKGCYATVAIGCLFKEGI